MVFTVKAEPAFHLLADRAHRGEPVGEELGSPIDHMIFIPKPTVGRPKSVDSVGHLCPTWYGYNKFLSDTRTSD